MLGHTVKVKSERRTREEGSKTSKAKFLKTLKFTIFENIEITIFVSIVQERLRKNKHERSTKSAKNSDDCCGGCYGNRNVGIIFTVQSLPDRRRMPGKVSRQ